MLRLDVDELDRTPKEPAYLILEARPLAVDALPLRFFHAEFSHELIQRPAEDQLAPLCVRTASVNRPMPGVNAGCCRKAVSRCR